MPNPLSRAFLAGLALAGTLTAQQAFSPFDAPTLVGSESNPPLRRLADLDLDGDLDAYGWQLSRQRTDFRVRSYMNDGHGIFATFDVVNGADVQVSAILLGEVGRLDAGPVPDLCLVHGTKRHVFYGKGDGSFSIGPIETLPAEAHALTLSDLDGDGRDDFVWADAKALRLKASSGLQASVAHGVVGPMTVRVLLRDGPGAADVFLVDGEGSVALFHGTPTSGITPVASFAHGVEMSMFDTGDIDGDGDVDGVAFGMHDYRVLRRTSAGGWALEPAVVGGPAQFLRDVDGDGDLDGACCGGGGPTFERNDQPSPFQIAINEGGVFAPAFGIPNLGSPELAGVADMDGDGDLDLVAGLCVYFSNGGVRPPPPAPPGSVVPVVHDPREVADCNGDGFPDVGFTLDSAYLNDGAGYFLATTHGVSGTPRGTFLRGPGFPGDFDGDGDLDLLVELHAGRARLLRATAPGRGRSLLGMALLQNDGLGALSFGGLASAAGVTFAIDSLEARASLTADLDADGDLDLITRALDPLASSPLASGLWLNDGTGDFQAAPFLDDLRVEVVADLDLDGLPDLVASEYPLTFGLPNLVILRALPAAPPSPPTYVNDQPGQAFGRLVSGRIATGNLFSFEFPDPGYPELLFLGGYPQGSFMSVNGFEPGTGGWGSVMLGSDMPADALAQVGDLNLDGLDDQLVGARGLVKRCEIRTRVGPTWWDGQVSNTQLLPTGVLVDLDLDGDLDLLGERVVLNRTIP